MFAVPLSDINEACLCTLDYSKIRKIICDYCREQVGYDVGVTLAWSCARNPDLYYYPSIDEYFYPGAIHPFAADKPCGVSSYESSIGVAINAAGSRPASGFSNCCFRRC